MTKKEKEQLKRFAIETAKSIGFEQAQENRWHDFYINLRTIAGSLGLTIRYSESRKIAGIDLFMMFDNPDQARQEGFDCNPYSGKFNFHGLCSETEIENVFNQFEMKG